MEPDCPLSCDVGRVPAEEGVCWRGFADDVILGGVVNVFAGRGFDDDVTLGGVVSVLAGRGSGAGIPEKEYYIRNIKYIYTHGTG